MTWELPEGHLPQETEPTLGPSLKHGQEVSPGSRRSERREKALALPSPSDQPKEVPSSAQGRLEGLTSNGRRRAEAQGQVASCGWGWHKYECALGIPGNTWGRELGKK